MKRIILFALGVLAAGVLVALLPHTATLRERLQTAWREFRAGWYGRGHRSEYGVGGGPGPASDDSELTMIIPTPSELRIRVEPLP